MLNMFLAPWLRFKFTERDEIKIDQKRRFNALPEWDHGVDIAPPAKELIFIGDGDFTQIGEEFLRLFIVLGHLKPHHRVLDVGCGIGRMALPLAKYLDGKGSYEGFDIVPAGIRWCQENITPRRPSFKFQVADVHSHVYHPEGKCSASNYKFPFADEEFDFVFLASVFTHMLPEDLENYFKEIARVMKPGGRSILTYFLLNDTSRRGIAAGKSIIQVEPRNEIYSHSPDTVPYNAVAYQEKFITDLYPKYGLTINQSPYRGAWSGHQDGLTFQDVIVGQKPRR
jgi:ubiquinone/menaquinone biosynthesis C-methylase UbiE